MDEIGDEFSDTPGNDKTGEELPELTNESDELNEVNDNPSEIFSETDEFDDDIPEIFSEPDEFDDDIPEVFSELDEFNNDIPEIFSEPDEFDDIIPERFSETDEFNDIIPERFSEPDEFDDILDDTIHDKEVGERAEEDQDSDDVGNVVENENIGPQSISTVLTSEIEEIENNMEHQEQEEDIEIRPEEYQDDTDPIVNTNESEFIKDVEELAEYARETKGEDESIEPHAEQENAAYYAEQYYESLKEKEVLNEQNSKEEQEPEELMQEVAEELKGDQESGYKSDELEKEDISEASKEITSTEKFEYLWEVRDKLDREGKQPKEIEEIMHEAEETYETLKNAEKLYEEHELEKLKLVDHEDEATEEDLKEELDRVDLVEQAIELEEKLVQQGELQEEIDARVEESIETTKFEEKLENIIEAQELEKLKLVDHEDEATEEDLKEELDRVDLVEQAVELEEKLVQQGESQEEINAIVEEAIEEPIETAEFEEKLEKIVEKQELEKLKIVNHEDEEDIDDAREEIDLSAEAEYYMEVEEELHRQGMSQEEIDEQMEEIASNYQNEINKKQEKEEDPKVSEELEKHDLETNEQNSSAEQCDQIELTSALSNEKKEESDEEENKHLQELYRQETGRRPIYDRQKSKGFSKWLEQQELGAEKINNSKSESEKKNEIDEKDWKSTLNQWIKEASEEECNAELKSELKKALESYNEFEDLARKYLELYEKAQNEKLSEKEKNRIKSLTDRLHELDPIQFELLLSVFIIKKYITKQYSDDFWNWPLVNRVLSKFFKYISQKILKLKKAQENKENLKEIIRNWIEQASEGEISPELKKKLKEIVANKENLEVLKLELDAIEIDSEDKKDLLEEITKLRSEESDEEKNERLQELYRRETGRRPIYSSKKTKGYSQWLEQRELRSEKIKSSKSEKKKEIEEEGWKTTLKRWIKEASEEECNAELKSELKKALESYDEFEYLTRKFLELYEKSQHEKLTEIEKNRLKFLTERLQGLGPIQLELLANIRAFKDYFYNHLWELLNRFFVNRVRIKFFKHISQKYKELRKKQKNEKIKYLINKNNCRMKKSFLESENLEFVENKSNIDFNFKKSFPIKISSTLDSPQSTLDKYLPPEAQKYLVPIVDQVISDYMQRVNEKRRLLPEYDPSIPISKFVVDLSSLDSTLVRDIISRKGKIRYQWWGFTYEWEDLWTGVTMTGKTTRPHPSRYWEYVLKSIYSSFNVVSLNIKIRNHFYKSINKHLKYDILNIKDELKTELTKDILKQIKVNGLIFHHLISENVLTHTITGEIDFDSIDFSSVKKSINNRFLFKFLKLTFSNNALSQCEIERILYQQRFGIALNRDKKSLGSSSAYNILNNTIFRLVAIGFTKPQITNFLNEIGYNVDLVLINTLLTDFFDGIQNARERFLNPVIDRFFALDMFKHYLDEIFDYFERGYSSIQISTLSGLSKIFLNSPEIVRRIVIKKYSPIYNDCSSFEQLRKRLLKNLFKDKISECVDNGIVNYATLLDRFDGLKNLPNDKIEFKRIQDFFREIFGSNLTDFVVDKYDQVGFNSIKPDKIKNRIYKFNKYLDLFNKEELLKDALKLIKKNIWEKLNTEYSARQLCIDLNFVRFGYSNNAFLQKGKVLLEKFTGTSFNDLIIQALDLQDKAIKLVCDNINDITVTSGFTGYTGLNLLIDLNLDRFLSIDSLINNRDRYIRKFIGFSSWEELLNFVKETYFKHQEVLNWEINFQYFFNFYKINPNKSSKIYFEKFPKVSENTIYRWIKKSKDILKKQLDY